MTTLSFNATKVFICAAATIVVSTLVSGSTYLSLLQLGYPLAAAAVKPFAYFTALILILVITISFVIGIGLRVYRRIRKTKTPIDQTLAERVQTLGSAVSTKMAMKRPVQFRVVRGFFGAGASTKKGIFVGEALARESTDNELEGAIGHEVAHLLRRHLRIKGVVQGLGFLVFLGSFLTEPGSMSEIALPVLLSWLMTLAVPLYWKLEYDADAMAAERLGGEILLQSLEKLKASIYGGASFTHPPLSKRIKRVMTVFPTKVDVANPTN